MPELPEVETTRRGIEPHVVGRRISRLLVHERRLRWPVDMAMPGAIAGSAIRRAGRRAKYLLLETEAGTLILHLGMSGSLRVLPATTPRIAHDHVDIELDSGQTLRFNDPRRFGSLFFTAGDPASHPLLKGLAPEPLEDGFDAAYLWKITRRRSVAIKQLIMNSRLVVGVGNIYASEALFRAGVHPARPAGRVSLARYEGLVGHVRTVLAESIEAGGTTLRDFMRNDGEPGYFSQALKVYGREGEACEVCGGAIAMRVIGQRSSFFCRTCQR